MKPLKFASLVILFLAFTFLSFGQKSEFTVKVIDISGVETIVENFIYQAGSSSTGYPEMKATRGDSYIDIEFSLIEFIQIHDNEIEKRGDVVSCSIGFRSGRVEDFALPKYQRFSGRSEFGDFLIEVYKVKSIEFIY